MDNRICGHNRCFRKYHHSVRAYYVTTYCNNGTLLVCSDIQLLQANCNANIIELRNFANFIKLEWAYFTKPRNALPECDFKIANVMMRMCCKSRVCGNFVPTYL